MNTRENATRARIARKPTAWIMAELEILRIYEGHEAATRRALLLEELNKRNSAND